MNERRLTRFDRLVASIVALATAILGGAVAFGVDLSTGEVASIVAVFAALAGVAQSWREYRRPTVKRDPKPEIKPDVKP